ncbi:MAG: hypothetical protein V3R83_06390 [Gammaproteobacteria bacterium]
MYLSSKQILDIVIYMLDTKLAYMLVDGYDNPGELDSVKRCRLALRTARAANGGQDRLHRSRPMNGEVPMAITDLGPLLSMRAIATANPVRQLGIGAAKSELLVVETGPHKRPPESTLPIRRTLY